MVADPDGHGIVAPRTAVGVSLSVGLRSLHLYAVLVQKEIGHGNTAKGLGSLEACWEDHRRFHWPCRPDSLLLHHLCAVWIGCPSVL